MGRRRLLALSLGVLTATGAIGAAERWQRDHELGSMRVFFDPPGMKYVLDETEDDRGRGWREGKTPATRTPGVPRVVCLGDSVTYGVSVGSRETWCEVVRRGLGGKTEAFNFGMNGYDAEQVTTLLEARVADWKPDVVVWGTYVNDVFPTYLLYGLETGDPVFVGTDIPERARILPESLALVLVRHSALFRRLQGAEYARSERAGGPSRAPQGWYGALLDRVEAWSKSTGIPVVYLAIAPHAMSDMTTCPAQFPVPGLCDASGEQYARITTALAERDVTWVDGLAAFQASGQPHYHPPGRMDPDHPNAAGHAVLGRAVLPVVRTILGVTDAPTTDAAIPDGGQADPDRPRRRGTPKVPGGGRRGAEGR